MTELTHLNTQGEASMVDIAGKTASSRTAIAQAEVSMLPAVVATLAHLPKGDALACARIAGIMAAKKTAELIPLCHPLLLCKIDIQFELQPTLGKVLIRALCKVEGSTGVEMEALTAVSIAALTLHDMAKAADPAIEINHIHLCEKLGGKSGHWRRDNA
ncbi:MAG: cyclic pyranopterin monophosphate synthase MoaC [Rheinheimera sp.]|nr:MAG: cyclic pyranopterin monophosphate synthase MoaC [Rheinheimera sp.]